MKASISTANEPVAAGHVTARPGSPAATSDSAPEASKMVRWVDTVDMHGFNYEGSQLLGYPHGTMSAKSRCEVGNLIASRIQANRPSLTVMDLGSFGFKQLTLQLMPVMPKVNDLVLQVVEWTLPDSDIGSWHLRQGTLLPDHRQFSPLTQAFVDKLKVLSRNVPGSVHLHTYNTAPDYFSATNNLARTPASSTELTVTRYAPPDVCVTTDCDWKSAMPAPQGRGNCVGGHFVDDRPVTLSDGVQPGYWIDGNVHRLGPWRRNTNAQTEAKRLGLVRTIEFNEYRTMALSVAQMGHKTFFIHGDEAGVSGSLRVPDMSWETFANHRYAAMKLALDQQRDFLRGETSLSAPSLTWCECKNASEQTRHAFIEMVAKAPAQEPKDYFLVDVGSGGWKQLHQQVSALASQVQSLRIDAIEWQLAPGDVGKWTIGAGKITPSARPESDLTSTFLDHLTSLSREKKATIHLRTFRSLGDHAAVMRRRAEKLGPASSMCKPDIVTWVDMTNLPVLSTPEDANLVIGQAQNGSVLGLFQFGSKSQLHKVKFENQQGNPKLTVQQVKVGRFANLAKASQHQNISSLLWGSVYGLAAMEQIDRGAAPYILAHNKVTDTPEENKQLATNKLGAELASALRNYDTLAGRKASFNPREPFEFEWV